MFYGCMCSMSLPHGAMSWFQSVIVAFPSYTELLCINTENAIFPLQNTS